MMNRKIVWAITGSGSDDPSTPGRCCIRQHFLLWADSLWTSGSHFAPGRSFLEEDGVDDRLEDVRPVGRVPVRGVAAAMGFS